jgi:hypothetical protein
VSDDWVPFGDVPVHFQQAKAGYRYRFRIGPGEPWIEQDVRGNIADQCRNDQEVQMRPWTEEEWCEHVSSLRSALSNSLWREEQLKKENTRAVATQQELNRAWSSRHSRAIDILAQSLSVLDGAHQRILSAQCQLETKSKRKRISATIDDIHGSLKEAGALVMEAETVIRGYEI